MLVNQGHPQPCHTLAVLQLNMQYSGVCRDLVVSYLPIYSCDVLFLQDTPNSLRSQFGGLLGYSPFFL